MTKCGYCKQDITGLPFHCRRCNKDFCPKHRLPEDHNCPGLKRGNIYQRLSRQKYHRKQYFKPHRKSIQDERFKSIKSLNFFKKTYYKIKYYLNKRHHSRYTNWNAFFMNCFWLVLLTIFLIIIYTNIKELNETRIWFLPLGGTLFFILLFFWIKYIWILLKRISYWFKGERLWIRYVIVILILFLAWKGYQNKETILDPFFEFKEKVDFSEIMPINLDIEWDDLKPSSVEDLDDAEASTIQKILYTASERKEECKEAFDYVNKIRKENGRNSMEWSDDLYELAVSRSKDMETRNYFDHVTPEGKCVKDFKSEYGFSNWNVAENCGGMTHYEDGTPIVSTSVNEAVDMWLTSRGHRYNLLYPSHEKGAIGCYKAICVFLGANQEYYGLGYGPCTTGDEGIAYWKSVGKQPGEI